MSIKVTLQTLKNKQERELKGMLSKKNPGGQMVVRANDAGVKDSCFVCGIETEPPAPFAVFKDGGKKPACGKCVQEHAPELGRML